MEAETVVKTHFTVLGIPAPKGSARAFFVKKLGRAVITSANAKTRPWEQAIRAEAANAQRGQPPQVAAMSVGVEFRFPRPLGHYRKDGSLKPSAPMRHTKKPDLDKLARTLLDGLTGVAFVDDSQVCSLVGSKRYVTGGEAPGAEVMVEEA